jgi:hypothetical protein
LPAVLPLKPTVSSSGQRSRSREVVRGRRTDGGIETARALARTKHIPQADGVR